MGFRVQGSIFRVRGLGLRVEGSVTAAWLIQVAPTWGQGLGVRVEGIRFRV